MYKLVNYSPFNELLQVEYIYFSTDVKLNLSDGIFDYIIIFRINL